MFKYIQEIYRFNFEMFAAFSPKHVARHSAYASPFLRLSVRYNLFLSQELIPICSMLLSDCHTFNAGL
jgi:hypothetical protein